MCPCHISCVQVLPEHKIDGQELKLQPTLPTKKYLAWWNAHGAAAAAEEDGEAGVDEEAREMEAMEQVLDLLTSRDASRGGGGGDRGGGLAARRAGGVRGGGDAADRLIDRAEARSCATSSLWIVAPAVCSSVCVLHKLRKNLLAHMFHSLVAPRSVQARVRLIVKQGCLLQVGPWAGEHEQAGAAGSRVRVRQRQARRDEQARSAPPGAHICVFQCNDVNAYRGHTDRGHKS